MLNHSSLRLMISTGHSAGLFDAMRGLTPSNIGCGSGRIMNRLARLHPNSSFTGIDLSSEAIGNAQREASAGGVANVEFIVADLTRFDEAEEAEASDLITAFDAVRDQARPLNILRGVHRALKAVGHFLGAFLYTISTMHCTTVSLAHGGEGLGAMWGEEKAREYLGEAGFRSVVAHQPAHDIQNNWYVIRT